MKTRSGFVILGMAFLVLMMASSAALAHDRGFVAYQERNMFETETYDVELFPLTVKDHSERGEQRNTYDHSSVNGKPSVL